MKKFCVLFLAVFMLTLLQPSEVAGEKSVNTTTNPSNSSSERPGVFTLLTLALPLTLSGSLLCDGWFQ